jgi:hypothetical protein
MGVHITEPVGPAASQSRRSQCDGSPRAAAFAASPDRAARSEAARDKR